MSKLEKAYLTIRSLDTRRAGDKTCPDMLIITVECADLCTPETDMARGVSHYSLRGIRNRILGCVEKILMDYPFLNIDRHI